MMAIQKICIYFHFDDIKVNLGMHDCILLDFAVTVLLEYLANMKLLYFKQSIA